MSAELQAQLLEFLRSLLHPEQFGWSVTDEVRKRARELLESAQHE